MDRGVSTARAVVGAVLVLALLVGGAFAAGLIGAPRVTGVQNHFAGVTDHTTTIDSALTVENPNVFAIDLGGLTVNYTVDLNGIRFANGTKRGVNLSTGRATLHFRTTMSNGKIPAWWIAHIRDGETSHLVVHARIHSSTLGRTFTLTPVDRPIHTDLLSAFDSKRPRPINAHQPLVSDPVLFVNETSAKWGSVTRQETPIEMSFQLYNPKTTPFTVTSLGYDITMNGVHVGSGEVPKGTTIPGRSQRRLDATTVIQNDKLDEWWVTHLRRNQVTDVHISFYARIELPTGQTLKVPMDALSYDQTMATDIFGNKNETANAGASAGASGGGSSSGASTTAASDQSAGTTTTAGSGRATPTTTARPSGQTETATASTATETPTTAVATTANPTTTSSTTETSSPGGGLLG